MLRYRIVIEVSVWERRESRDGKWRGSKKLRRAAISFDLAHLAAIKELPRMLKHADTDALISQLQGSISGVDVR